MAEQPYILTLPPHLLSDVFTMGQDEEHFRHPARPKPFSEIISHVCGLFRWVALDTSRLWSTIHIAESTSPCRVKVYCERSRSMPLTILVRLGGGWDHDYVVTASVFEAFCIILQHAQRWRVLSLVLARDPPPPLSVVDFLNQPHTPLLRSLTLSITTANGPLASHYPMGFRSPRLLTDAPRLSLVRFRGVALHLMRPPLTLLNVLHLDHAFGSRIPYGALKELLTTPRHLQHLSIEGDIVNDYPQSMSPSTVIHLPSLLTLRLACKDGRLYLGTLLNIEAPCLRRLILKDARNGDLERRGVTASFPQVTELVFVNFDLSAESYRHLIPMFPSVEIFCAPCSTVESLFPKVFQHKVKYGGTDTSPWPNLRILHLGFDAGESARPLQRLLDLRHRLGCPISKVIFNTKVESGVKLYLALLRLLGPTPTAAFSIEDRVGTQDGLGHWLAGMEGQTIDYDDAFN